MNHLCYNCFHKKSEQDRVCPVCGYENGSAAQSYPLALPEGSVLAGKYIVGRVLGQGGFGITYIAQDYHTGERIALKEYFPDTVALRDDRTRVVPYTGDKQEYFFYGKDCFLSEAQTLSRFIGNDNICRIYSYFEENNTAYFAMEYIDGESLQSMLNRRGGKIGYEEAKNILLPVMDALSAVHAQGIIHRDISPDNIVITKGGTVKLLDFGAARYSLGDKSRSLDVVLKHGYAPKEQYTRRGRQGPFTDVYSLSATFYRAITGRTPPDSIDRMEEDDLIAPSILCPGIPEYAEEALLKGLSVSVSDRYQTVDELKRDLTAVSVSDPASYPQTMISPKTVPASGASHQTEMHPAVGNDAHIVPQVQQPLKPQTSMHPAAGNVSPPKAQTVPQHQPAMSFDRIDEEEEKNKPKNQLTKKEARQLLKDPEKFREKQEQNGIDSYQAAKPETDKIPPKKWIIGLLPMVIGALLIAAIIWICVDFNHTEIIEMGDFQYEVGKFSVTVSKYLGNEENVEIPAKIMEKPVTVIGGNAFTRTDVQTVTVPGSVTTIKGGAFSDCKSLEKFIILLPSSMKTLENSIFDECYNLTSFYVPDSVETISSTCFAFTNLNYLSIPKHLEGGEYLKFVPDDCEIEVRE